MKIKVFIAASSNKSKKFGTSNWFEELSDTAKQEYIDEHPNSQYAKHHMRMSKHKERKARTGQLSNNLDPRFKEASEGLDPNLLKEVSKLDEDLQQSFAKRFSGAMEEFGLDADSEETTSSLENHKNRALKAKKDAENATNPIAKKKALATFERERNNYKELKLANQKALDVIKTPGKLNKFKNQLGRQLLSKLSKVQADESI
jgi:hypothetical protein